MAQARKAMPATGDGDYAELRSLLLAPEQSRLEELQEQVEHIDLNAQNVSRLLPDAIALRGEHDQRLTRALTPHVSDALGTSVRTQPQMIVDAIAPIMMPAIRQSIANALRSMVQSLNQTIEHSLSLRSMQWRLEALRTGKPFAEIVLLHTLCYRVEQVFLIHSQTGLLLAHAAGDSVAVQDETLVSGMLSAIRAFVQDSFGAAPDQVLNTLRVGELTVWIEQGPVAILAAVIRGTPPEHFHVHLQDTLTRIHAAQADALARFEGDASNLAGVTPLLEDCLQAQFEPRGRAVSPMTWALVAALLLGAVWWGASVYQERQRWQTLVARLGAEPGLALTAVETEGRQYRLTGLRDPLAADPATLLQESGLDPEHISAHWRPYYSLDAAFLLKRAGLVLSPPTTVQFALEGTRLTASGTAPAEWIRERRTLARLLPGLDHYDDRRLTRQSLDAVTQELAQASILFEQGRADIRSSEQRHSLSRIADLLGQIEELAHLSGTTLTIRINGQTDIIGDQAQNRRLSEIRAQSALDAIHPTTFSSITFETHGVTPSPESHAGKAAAPLPEDRRVSFQVTVHQAP
ncbi:MAG: OmpA family protein [Nitrospira sp. CR1.2]|nr:OmpA family protein [Nitrospira sp. CR1.2]